MKTLQIISLLLITVYSKGQNVQWVNSTGSNMQDGGLSVTTDLNGDIYHTGYFRNSISFGTFSFTSNGFEDLFVTKSSPTGNIIWSKQIGGGQADFGYSIVSDNAGAIYVSGLFSSSCPFGTVTLNSGGIDDIFVIKLDATNGNVLWAKGMGSALNSDYESRLALDGSGDVFITGYYSGNAIFGSTILTSQGIDAFVAKLSNTNGNIVWAVKFGGTGDDRGKGISTDAAGDVYATGFFNLAAIFGTTTLNSAGNKDIFVTKLNPTNGNIIWANRFGGTLNDEGTDVVCGSNIYLTGSFTGTIQIGSNTLTTNSSSSDIFITALNPSTANSVWVSKMGGNTNDFPKKIALNNVGDVLTSGFCQFNSSFGSYSVTSASNSNVFLTKTDKTNGNVIWVNVFEKPTQWGLAVDLNNNIYLTGEIGNPATFDSFTVTSIGSSDIFLAKINDCSSYSITTSASSLTICQGNTISLQASGASTINWNNGVNNGIPFIPANTSTYIATGTFSTSVCSKSAQVIVAVNPLPTININLANSTVCSGENIVLQANGATTYSWSSGILNGVSFLPLGTSTYSVVGTDNNNCQNSASVQIIVDPCTFIPNVSSQGLISIYPNPASNFLQIKGLDENERMVSLKIIDMLGQTKIYLFAQTSMDTVDISNLTSGIYTVIVEQANKQSLMIKIVKK